MKPGLDIGEIENRLATRRKADKILRTALLALTIVVIVLSGVTYKLQHDLKEIKLQRATL